MLTVQEYMSSCSTARHAFFLDKPSCLLVEQEDMYSCLRSKHVFLFNQMTRLLVQETCLLVEQRDIKGAYGTTVVEITKDNIGDVLIFL